VIVLFYTFGVERLISGEIINWAGCGQDSFRGVNKLLSGSAEAPFTKEVAMPKL
jgi:hypothetical protein